MADEPSNLNPAPKKGLSKKTLGIVLGVALLQGAGFFVVFKFIGSSPEPAHGEESHAIEAKQSVGVAEVALLRSFKVPNDKTGRLWIYDIDISVVVAANQAQNMQELADAHAGEIADRVARIIRAATPEMLGEDDLSILRGQLTEGLADITGDQDLIQRVLIPRLVPIPS